MAPYQYLCSGKSGDVLKEKGFLQAWGRSSSKAPVSALPTPPAEPAANAHNVFRGAGRNLETCKQKTASRMRSARSMVSKAAGCLASYAQPAVVEKRGHGLTPSHHDDLPAALIIPPGQRAVAGKTNMTNKARYAARADTVLKTAKHQEQLYDSCQLQGDQADAAASKLVSGTGVVSAAVRTSVSVEQPSKFRYLDDAKFYDAFPEQQQGADIDSACCGDAYDRVTEQDWRALLADPKMAAIMAELQARVKAC